MRRVLNIPAGQVRMGDVLLMDTEEAVVVASERDDFDSSCYLAWKHDGEVTTKYFDPWEHVKLVCNSTFGRDYGEGFL
jgi:hypothetical protein